MHMRSEGDGAHGLDGQAGNFNAYQAIFNLFNIFIVATLLLCLIKQPVPIDRTNRVNLYRIIRVV